MKKLTVGALLIGAGMAVIYLIGAAKALEAEMTAETGLDEDDDHVTTAEDLLPPDDHSDV